MQQGTNARTDFQSSVAIHELLNELILQKYQLDFEEEDIPAYVYKLKQYLDEHFKETITLDQLEQQFLLNKYRRETFVNSADSYNMYVIFSKYFEIYR